MRTVWLWLAVACLATAGGGWWYHVTRPAYRWQRGQEALRDEDWHRVEAIARKLEGSGEADRARLLRGEALYRQRRYADAVAELNQVRDEGDLRLRAAMIQGKCFLRLNLLRQGHLVFSFVVDQQPDNADAHRGLAALYYDLGDLNRAVSHLEQVARLVPDDGRPYRQIGLIDKDLAQNADAVAAYRKALGRELNPTVREEVRLELAEVLVKQLDYQAALEVLDRPAPDTLESVRAMGLRAECLSGLSRADEARDVLDRALQRDPSDGLLLRLRGQMYLSDGQPEQAAALLEKAVALDPQDDLSRYQLALAYSRMNREKDAAEQQERVKEIRDRLELLTRLSKEAMDRPWEADVRLRLAEVCQQSGRANLAQMWRRAAEACSASPSTAD
jgi:tetratricopeptide (TPR) repeat protein